VTTRFFEPFQELVLPKEFLNPSLVPAEDLADVIWGPFLGLLLKANRDNLERIDEWKQKSSEVVIYLKRLDSDRDCLIQWWTHREHIFLISECPSIDNGILILKNPEEDLELWLRPPNNREDYIYTHTKSLFLP